MFFTETFPSFHFEGDHFITLHQVADDFCFNYSFHSAACGNSAGIVCKQYIFEFNLVTGFTLQVRNVQALSRLNLELLTCDFYNC